MVRHRWKVYFEGFDHYGPSSGIDNIVGNLSLPWYIYVTSTLWRFPPVLLRGQKR